MFIGYLYVKQMRLFWSQKEKFINLHPTCER